jgi:hypothetical protein
MAMCYIATFVGIPQMIANYERGEIITLIEQREEAMKWGLLPEQIEERKQKEKEYQKYASYIKPMEKGEVYGSSKTKKEPRWFLAEEKEICDPNEKNQQIWRL